MIRKILYIFLISMLPIIELRGAIPAGFALGIPAWVCFAVSILGNMLPVPFIIFFIKKIILWMEKVPKLDKVAFWLEEKAHKNATKVTRYATWGLLIFVGIPLPGTGAWTGALVAAMLDMDMKKAFWSILGGVVLAGVIVTAICSGVLGFLSFLL